MSNHKSFLEDPRILALHWPGLQRPLFAWIDANNPRPFDVLALHAFLSRHGYTVVIEPGVWRIENEQGLGLRQARYDTHENAEHQAYGAALDWLQQETVEDGELRRLIEKRDDEILDISPSSRYHRAWRAKKRDRQVLAGEKI